MTSTPRALAVRAAQPLTWPLLPVLAYQGRKVQRDGPRLPRAAGNTGACGVRPAAEAPLRLLVLGDSVAAGVGVAHNSEGLAGQLADAVTLRTGRPVDWRVAARPGATAEWATRRLAPDAADGTGSPDVVVVSVGVNDLLAFRRPARWRAGLRALAHAVRAATAEGHEAPPVVFVGLPPVARLPALPQPLRAVLAARSARLDHVLAQTAREVGARHVPSPPLTDEGPLDTVFAEDRFHPSTRGYALLARELAPVVASLVAPDGSGRTAARASVL